MNNAQGFAQMPMGVNTNKNQNNNALNYKIVKCKNFEKDGTCKYGAHCTFAHGDNELRNKQENMMQMNNPMMMPIGYNMEGIPFILQPGMDMNPMQLMMPSPAVPANMGQNPFMMNNVMKPPMQGINNNNQNAETKNENEQQ